MKFRKATKYIKADVIVLGCTLPGIVTANKLKRKFGDTMDIVVLDLAAVSKAVSKCNVAFQQGTNVCDDSESSDESENTDRIITEHVYTISQHYLIKYANEFKVPLPSFIMNPTAHKSVLHKVFQYPNGSSVLCGNDFNNFTYLSFLERFELNQYNRLLDKSMKRLFYRQTFIDLHERDLLMYYDQTTMENSLCNALLFTTSRDLMRATVKLVCGASADRVSILFYLHQCYRTTGNKHHIDGRNTRVREKLLGYCRKRLTVQLQASIADITLPAKSIKNIRTDSESNVHHVILETKRGDTMYRCNLLAMALKPDQLQTIEVDNNLLPDKAAMITAGLTPGKAKKFYIQYEENFWRDKGFSGDIFSLKGPIIWAIEKPTLSLTGSVERYPSIIGYLMVKDDETEDSKAEVVEQLTDIFGTEASSPVAYRETSLADIYVPRCGDYVAFKILTNQVSPKGLEWGALDVFAEGDVAAALEAGHSAYLHLLSCLRPQAQTFEDTTTIDRESLLNESPIGWWLAHINVLTSIKMSICAAVMLIGAKLIHSYLRK